MLFPSVNPTQLWVEQLIRPTPRSLQVLPDSGQQSLLCIDCAESFSVDPVCHCCLKRANGFDQTRLRRAYPLEHTSRKKDNFSVALLTSVHITARTPLLFFTSVALIAHFLQLFLLNSLFYDSYVIRSTVFVLTSFDFSDFLSTPFQPLTWTSLFVSSSLDTLCNKSCSSALFCEEEG